MLFFINVERNLVLRDNMPPLNQSEYQITPLPSPGSGLVINTKSTKALIFNIIISNFS